MKQPHHLTYLQFLLRLRGMLEEEIGELEARPDLRERQTARAEHLELSWVLQAKKVMVQATF